MSLSDMRIRREFNIGIHCKLSSEGCESFLGCNDHWGGEIWLRLTARDSAGVGGLVIGRGDPGRKNVGAGCVVSGCLCWTGFSQLEWHFRFKAKVNMSGGWGELALQSESHVT